VGDWITGEYDMKSGLIIILNGGSSSGKTSLAIALQELMPEPFAHFDADIFRILMPQRFCHWAPFAPPSESDNLFISGFHRAAAGFASVGNNIIIDHMFSQREWLLDAISVFEVARAYAVGVKCDIDVAMRRERERKNRTPGLAAFSATSIHDQIIYDLEVDTTSTGSRKIAENVKTWLDGNPKPRALERLRIASQMTSIS
jgi:chloramphenicol 3-O phosphotransferase